MSEARVWVVVPAAGVGRRMQSAIPKQYLKINGCTVLQHTLNCFSDHADIDGIVVALHAEDPYWNSAKIDVPGKKLYTVEGGEERSDSVLNALEYLTLMEQLDDSSWVMVHDAARPCLQQQDINSLLAIRNDSVVGGILATPVRDTMKRSIAATNEIAHSENRENLWHALTPQLFRLGELRESLKTALAKGIQITDESSALESAGKHPLIVEGCSSNIKITQAADLELAGWFLSAARDKKRVENEA